MNDAPPEKLQENQIRFITFNYDRSLEQYLWTVIKSSYNLNDTKIGEILRKIPITHVYGQLDPLPWQDQDSRAYGATLKPGNLEKIAERIKTINDSTQQEVINEAKNYLKEASAIYFLGFGYHKENMTRLDISSLGADKRIGGTAYNLRTAQRDEITLYFSNGPRNSLGKDAIILGSSNERTLDFLQEYVLLQ